MKKRFAMRETTTRAQPLFSGLMPWGAEHLPKDMFLTLNNIRGWALQKALILDPELQLLSPERIQILAEHFVPEDKLSVLIHLYEDSEGNLTYLEHPHLPIRSLIKRATRVDLVYWTMRPTLRSADGDEKGYGEVRIGFWYPGVTTEEFCSVSNARLVVEKFAALYDRLSDSYPSSVLENGALDITVDGDVKARFFKSGRLFDVEFT